MIKIKAVGYNGGLMTIMDPSGEIVTCPRLPGVQFDEELDDKMPWFDTETNDFVCGCEEAEVALREILAHALKLQGKKLPDFIMLDPLLKGVVKNAG